MPEQIPDAGGQHREKLAAVLRQSPNGPWLRLPGPTDLAPSFADAILASDVLADLLRAERAKALREAVGDPALRLSGHSGISITRLRDRADRVERGE